MASKEYYIINFKAEQRRAIKTAKELYYDDYVVTQLKEATTVSQLNYILSSARTNAK